MVISDLWKLTSGCVWAAEGNNEAIVNIVYLVCEHGSDLKGKGKMTTRFSNPGCFKRSVTNTRRKSKIK